MKLTFERRRNGRYGREWKSAANPIFDPLRNSEKPALRRTPHFDRDSSLSRNLCRARLFAPAKLHHPRQSDTDPVGGEGPPKSQLARCSQGSRLADMDPGTNCRCWFLGHVHRRRQILLAAQLGESQSVEVAHSIVDPSASAPLPTRLRPDHTSSPPNRG
jgi:hypothetical protein